MPSETHTATCSTQRYRGHGARHIPRRVQHRGTERTERDRHRDVFNTEVQSARSETGTTTCSTQRHRGHGARRHYIIQHSEAQRYGGFVFFRKTSDLKYVAAYVSLRALCTSVLNTSRCASRSAFSRKTSVLNTSRCTSLGILKNHCVETPCGQPLDEADRRNLVQGLLFSQAIRAR
jgi:hypothetical protein